MKFSSSVNTHGIPLIFLFFLATAMAVGYSGVPSTAATGYEECGQECPTPAPTASGSQMTGTGSTGSGSTGSGSTSTPVPSPGGIVPVTFLGFGGIGGPVFTPTSTPSPSPVPFPDSEVLLPELSIPLSPADGGAPASDGGFSDTAPRQCPYVTAFMKYGIDNDEEQVRLLQRFLRDYEKADVEETGVFDLKTLSAVHAFQQKYPDDILTPWDITESTGIVSITTRKKINEIVCGEVRGLTPQERQEIQRIIGLLNSGRLFGN